MKLSEAIRLNGMTLPQGIGNPSMAGSEPCALGGALLAIGKKFETPEEGYGLIQKIWPWTEDQMNCPCLECRWWQGPNSASAGKVIWHLNDYHRWTRQQIADWVETVEPKEEPSETVERGSDRGVEAGTRYHP